MGRVGGDLVSGRAPCSGVLAILRGAFAAAALAGGAAAQTATAPLGQLPPAEAATGVPGNVLLIVADDVGVDKLGTYGEHPSAAATPTIDWLAGEGVLFRNAYAYPICSPTRAALLTGRHAFRTGISDNVQYAQPVYALPFSEVILPDLIELGAGGRYANALVGKWHLGSAAWGAELHPFLHGWQRHRGVQTNFGAGESYTDWTKWVGGKPAPSQAYVTSEQVDDAIDLITNLPEPWFVLLALTAAHTPFHAPPAHLHSYALAGEPDLTPVEHFDAAVQALDTELGRLFASVPPAVLADTTVLLLGDNGAPGLAVTAPANPKKAKGTLFEGGVNVPFVAWGKRVTARGAECAALVSAVDLYATVAELCGFDARDALPAGRTLDGLSLVPYFSEPGRAPDRTCVFAEKSSPNGFTFGLFPIGVPTPLTRGRMLRDERWKLIERLGQADHLYDMEGLDFEGQNLLEGPLTPEQQAAYERLKAELQQLVTS